MLARGAKTARTEGLTQEIGILQGLRDMGARLYACRDRQELLDTILSQARRQTRSEAGTLYLVQEDRLRFVAVQNDRIDTNQIARHLLGKEMALSSRSLAGFVALTGRTMNIPNSYALPIGAPFRINRDFDAKTGYRVKSILAIPLSCPDGSCVGVLQLINRRSALARIESFSKSEIAEVMVLASTAAIALHNVNLHDQVRKAHLNTIFRLATMAEYRDEDTSNHIQQVSRTSELVARAAGLEASQCELLRYASPMHDVGKVAIPDAILLKPGHLTPAQRQLMQQHTLFGAEIFKNAEDEVLSMARDVALNHHERWDGQGYPRGLKGKAIPLPSRIVGLADVFDAIVSRRCYKNACSLDVALAIIKDDTGKHFDPAVVEAFNRALDGVLKSYPGLRTAAETSTAKVAQ